MVRSIPFVVILLLLALASIVFYLYNFSYVSSESMTPTLKIGDIIVYKDVDKESLDVGDIVVYKSEKTTVTHRVIKINERGVVTKGDNAPRDDGLIPFDNIEGKVVERIPWVGLLKTPDLLMEKLSIAKGNFLTKYKLSKLDLEKRKRDAFRSLRNFLKIIKLILFRR